MGSRPTIGRLGRLFNRARAPFMGNKTEVPEWRRGAAAGISLAAARAMQLPATNGQGNGSVARIVRPEAQTRWLLPQLSAMTPQFVETILRGAMAGNHVQQWELFQLMEETWPRLQKNLNELKGSAIAYDWKIETYQEEDAETTDSAKERAKLVQRAVKAMRPRPGWDESGFSGMIYDLLDAWASGTSVVEIGWQLRGEEWLPQSSYFVHPNNYGWTAEGYLGLIAPGQRTTVYGGAYAEPFPEDKFLVGIRRAKSGHPLCGALLRSLAWWWCAANFSADWLLNFAQIFGLPMRWANYDPSAPQETINTICDMLQNMGSAGYAAFPAGTQMELKESSKGGAGSLPQDNIIDRADKNCDLLILGQTLTTDVGNSGSRALGEVHAKVKSEVIQAAANFVASVLNEQWIPALLRLNFGDEEEAPEFCPQEAGADEVEQLKFKREVFKGFMQDGTVADVLANQTDFKQLTRDVGLPVNEEYIDPYLPVTAEPGAAVTGGTIKDAAGDVVGGLSIGEQTTEPAAPDAAPGATPPSQAKPDSTGEVIGAERQRQRGTPDVKLEQASQEGLVRALTNDLQPVLQRLDAIMTIADPVILENRLRAFLGQMDQLKKDLAADPASGVWLQKVLATALVNGLNKKNMARTE